MTKIKIGPDEEKRVLCRWVHTWSRSLSLCPQHNGTEYHYCVRCGVMALTENSKDEMNRLNREATGGAGEDSQRDVKERKECCVHGKYYATLQKCPVCAVPLLNDY